MAVQTRPSVRVVVVEQDDLYRDLLRTVLGQYPGIELVGVYASSAEVLREGARARPEVAIIDIDMSGQNGIQVAVRLQRQLPELGVVLLVSSRDCDLLNSVPNNLLLGWSYFVNKSTHGLTTLLRAVQITHARLLNLGQLEATTIDYPSSPTMLPELTRRQREILSLVAQGLTNRAVAEHLHLKEKTVENQLATIYNKFQVDADRAMVHPRVWAALYYQQSNNGVERAGP